MGLDYNIAFYTSLLSAGRSRVGHMWRVDKWTNPPMYYGQPYPELDQPLRDQTETYNMGVQKLSFSTDKHKTAGAGLITSLFNKLGVIDINAEKLKKVSFTLDVELFDYTRLAVAPAIFDRIVGMKIPKLGGTGRWVFAYAQHEALSGRFTISYAKQGSAAVGVELSAKGSANLNHEHSSENKHTYNFKADVPIVFGMSVVQIMESKDHWTKFGNDHKKIVFLHS